VYNNRVWLAIAVGGTRSFFVQLVCVVIPNVVGNSETPHRYNALVEHLSAVMFVKHYL
jgi:hypothetical protein